MENMHDFNDDNGLVPAHRHINPDNSEGGWIKDGVARIAAGVFIHATVEIRLTVVIGYRASIGDGASIGSRASIGDGDLWITFCNVGSRRAVLTAVKRKEDGEMEITTGCFQRKSVVEFKAAVKERHGGNVYELEYKAVITCILAYFKAHAND